MLHELLLALNGYPGSIFVKGHNGQIQVVGELPFIHPTEVALLNRLCLLASHYKRFTDFIRRYGHAPGTVSRRDLHGLYLKALCQGLHLVLDPYRDALVDLEGALLADPHLTAAHVQSRLEQYQMLFPALSMVLDQIIDQQAHGCYILEVLHKAAVSGIPLVKQALQRVLHVCQAVFFKQLSAWMLHGMLLDRYGEFIIALLGNKAPLATVAGDDEDVSLAGVSGRQLQQMVLSDPDPPSSSSYECYGIRADKLPSYLPARVAEKILFVGESVQMFERNTPGTKGQGHKGSILRGREDTFSRDLHELSQTEVLDVMTFETVVDKIRGYVAEQLWRLIVEESDLVGNLRIMKDFYLLGRGELFLAFIDQAQALLRPVPTGTTEHDINMAFQHAARNVLFEDETILQRFRLMVDAGNTADTKTRETPARGQPMKKSSSSDAVSSQAQSGWTLLRLDYSVQWPLHILLTKGVLDRYNSLFHFLLYVKRVQLELQQTWAQQMQTKRGHQLDTAANRWWLRNHMAFLVDNLQYYLQVDVIESQFSVLCDKVQTTRDFEEIRLAHDTFLTSLLSQSFLLMKPIAHCLSEILELCHLYCGLVSQADVVLTEREHAKMDDITKSFQRQSSLLFKILSSVRSHQASPHLAQLLLRIDYNKYFTMAGGRLGSYQTVTTTDSPYVSSARRK